MVLRVTPHVLSVMVMAFEGDGHGVETDVHNVRAWVMVSLCLIHIL
jgi:hypothetical protein